MRVLEFKHKFVVHVPIPGKGRQANYFEKRRRGRSLCLSVSYAGTRCWRVVYYVSGKPRSEAIGYFPEMGVEKARRVCDTWELKAELKASPAPGLSFKAVAEDWLKDHVERNKLRSAYELKRLLHKYVYPA